MQASYTAVVRQAVTQSLMLGVLVASTSTGTLALPWVLEGAVVLLWIPALQIVAVAAIARALGARERWPAVVLGYGATHGPWFTYFLILSFVAIVSPDHRVFLSFYAISRYLLLATMVTWALSIRNKAIFFHRQLGLSVPRTALGLIVLGAVYLGAPLAYLIITRQLPFAVMLGYL